MNEEFEKMRAEFEDWYSALIGKTANLMRNDAYYDRPRYGNAKTDIAWLAWQASRKQALEEAIGVAEHVAEELRADSKPDGFFAAGAAGVSACIYAIRALQKT